ncbi:MAG: hypothetical protein LAP13_17835 [Acidobacteriia bacterium]|nr:hypothetical protein [Terriglobia bacterium]
MPWHKPVLEDFGRPVSGSLANVIRLFKQAVTCQVTAGDADERAHHGVPLRVWQRGYYEHIVRNDDELAKIREYIRTNPLRWASGRYNPERGVLVRDETGCALPWEKM